MYREQTQNHLISLIRSSTKIANLLQIHAHLIRTRSIEDPFICLDFLSRIIREISYARRVFDQLPNPKASHYNTVIRGYSLSDSPEQGFYLYRLMRLKGVPTNPLSCSFAIKSCIKFRYLIGGLQVHARITRDGYQSDDLLMTTLMELYSASEKPIEACNVFDGMSQRDTVSWNVLISCYLRNQRSRDALCLFDNMKYENNGCEPDEVTCLLVLQACGHLGALEFGEKVHSYVKENGYDNAPKVCNSLIAMYSRCGSLEKAYKVFQGIKHKTVVSWSAMISGFAMNGYGRQAIDAFEEMVRRGVLPDEQTLTGVLSACSHSGLVDEGMTIFHRMSKDFGILPNVRHYGCMVDLLGRAGLLDQAYRLIMSMRVKPDSTIWRTLLGACRVHGNVTLGEKVLQHLIELKAQDSGDYVLMLNMYSSAEEWEKVKELRMFMKERGIQTTPGCSTIEWKGELHEFVADDVSHPKIDDIYNMLEEINQQLKIGGYVTEITSELHNLNTKEKELALSYHSEKLAIAFAILVTPPGTTIRVAKNLRTCVDCHNFAKALSHVYDRRVIIRDRTRFHHFQNGRCSCNDYW